MGAAPEHCLQLGHQHDGLQSSHLGCHQLAHTQLVAHHALVGLQSCLQLQHVHSTVGFAQKLDVQPCGMSVLCSVAACWEGLMKCWPAWQWQLLCRARRCIRGECTRVEHYYAIDTVRALLPD